MIHCEENLNFVCQLLYFFWRRVLCGQGLHGKLGASMPTFCQENRSVETFSEYLPADFKVVGQSSREAMVAACHGGTAHVNLGVKVCSLEVRCSLLLLQRLCRLALGKAEDWHTEHLESKTSKKWTEG